VAAEPQWTLRCKVCHAAFGPIQGAERVGRLVDGGEPLACGHEGAEILSQKM
jgi:hypothetical protein